VTSSFPGIHPDAFVHPEDKAALEALRNVPGLSAVLKKFSGGLLERRMHAFQMHHQVRLGPKQYPSLHRMVERACQALDIEQPTAYLSTGYKVNAFAFGMQEYTVTLYSGLVDLLEEDEVQAVVGHEIGHIACDHMLYKSLAHLLGVFGTQALGALLGSAAKLISIPLQLALLRWSRAAELSCDRAALLVTGKPQTVAHVSAMLAGATTRYRHEFDLDAVLEQYKDFEENACTMDRWMERLQHAGLTHPEPIRRAREILDWSESQQYKDILAGRYTLRSEAALREEGLRIEGVASCPLCRKPVANLPRCPSCRIRLNPRHQLRCPPPQPHLNDAAWKFCKTCGAELKRDES